VAAAEAAAARTAAASACGTAAAVLKPIHIIYCHTGYFHVASLFALFGRDEG
jgi:hypothetical protein